MTCIPDIPFTLATLQPRSDALLTKPSILSDEWVTNTLATKCINVRNTNTIGRIFVYAGCELATLIIITYDVVNNVIILSRSEFSNLNKDVLPTDYLIALPYPLYAMVTKLQTRLRETVGCPVKIDILWGWGMRGEVHMHMKNVDYNLITNYPKIDKTTYPHIDWSDDPVKNATIKQHIWKETSSFIFAIQDVFDNFQNNVSYSVDII